MPPLVPPSRRRRNSVPRIALGAVLVLAAAVFSVTQPTRTERGILQYLLYLCLVPALLLLAGWLVWAGLSKKSQEAGLALLLAAVVGVILAWWWYFPTYWAYM
jgi:uncharacterized membrane protein